MIRGTKASVGNARRLRRKMSLPEGLLWRELRRRPGGHKFRRQHPAGPYVLDFFCAAANLAIEVDGAGHDGRVDHDAKRGAYLADQGVQVIRIPARAVLDDPEAAIVLVLETIRQTEAG